MKQIRNSKGQFDNLVGSVISNFGAENTGIFIVLAHRKKDFQRISFTGEKTQLHLKNIKVKNWDQIQVLRRFSKSRIQKLITKINHSIKSPVFTAYNGVGKQARDLLGLVLEMKS